MERYKIVEGKVEELYRNGRVSEGWDLWIKWSYPNHVSVVAKNTKRLVEQFGGNMDFAMAGALLHDIADVRMERTDPHYEEECERLMQAVLGESGFAKDEIEIIIEDVITPHSCRETIPKILEGKMMATADAMAHLSTDFYLYFAWQHWGNNGDSKTYHDFQTWMREKIERDFHRKIFFPEIQEEMRPFYQSITTMLTRVK